MVRTNKFCESWIEILQDANISKMAQYMSLKTRTIDINFKYLKILWIETGH